jgi:short-subunit dehydrogenase
MSKIWLITGCSTGIGRSLSIELLHRGHCVVATARDPNVIDFLKEINSKGLITAKLDVTNPNEITKVVKRAMLQFGSIDVLVNNAGYGYYGSQEEADVEEIQKMFDTNVFGLIRVTQAVLPIMRQKRYGSIVNISSLGGRIALPFMGFYHASKHAIEGLSEALYFETSNFGIRVIIIEPGGHNTNFSKSGVRSSYFGNKKSPYASLLKKWKETNKKIIPKKNDPINVANAIINAVDQEMPFQRIQVGTDSESLIRLRENASNDLVFLNQIYKLYGLGKKLGTPI